MDWIWEKQSPAYGAYGNPNQFTVGGGMQSLARETAQNANDARLPGEVGELHFTFIPLTGEARRSFEEAISWPTLESHLAAMAASNQVVAASIRMGLERLRDQDELLLLRIEDRWCQGLTGPELTTVPESDFGHFIKLCRLDLFSGKDQAAGGSFGLGKAVYWRFSQIQTVLFNSLLSEPFEGQTTNRIFGVNQGTVHTIDEDHRIGRGYFGRKKGGYVESSFADQASVDRLNLSRSTDAPGTTALIVGFWDPDNPEHTAEDFAGELEEGLAEAFWPLITRGGMRFFVDIEGDPRPALEVDPSQTYPELVGALQAYDGFAATDSLEEAGDVVVRDIPILVPKRKTTPGHDIFTHSAKLVVTLSDEDTDSLENKVCLLRGPEMVVEQIDEEFPGVTYHAMLLAGEAVDPGAGDHELRLADDFLRIAEPPSHDRWVPRGPGSLRTSLAANYQTPYVKNLREIQDTIKAELRDLFGVVVRGDDRPPEAIARYLRVLSGGTGQARVGKPTLEITSASVEAGKWRIWMTATMKNRPAGWQFHPQPVFVGAEGGQTVAWEKLEAIADCTIRDDRVVATARGSGRIIRASFCGTTDPESHPIPAERSAIDVRVTQPEAVADEEAS